MDTPLLILAGMYRHLRDEGEATKSDFKKAMFENHRAGYDSDKYDSWWKNLGGGGALKELADRRDDLQAPRRGQSKYRFVGTDVDGE